MDTKTTNIEESFNTKYISKIHFRTIKKKIIKIMSHKVMNMKEIGDI